MCVGISFSKRRKQFPCLFLPGFWTLVLTPPLLCSVTPHKVGSPVVAPRQNDKVTKAHRAEKSQRVWWEIPCGPGGLVNSLQSLFSQLFVENLN